MLQTRASVVVRIEGKMTKSVWSIIVGRLLARSGLLTVIWLLGLVSGAEERSVAFGVAFIALATFVLVHSYKERRRKRLAH
jgi:hypothetical protein